MKQINLKKLFQVMVTNTKFSYNITKNQQREQFYITHYLKNRISSFYLFLNIQVPVYLKNGILFVYFSLLVATIFAFSLSAIHTDPCQCLPLGENDGVNILLNPAPETEELRIFREFKYVAERLEYASRGNESFITADMSHEMRRGSDNFLQMNIQGIPRPERVEAENSLNTAYRAASSLIRSIDGTSANDVQIRSNLIAIRDGLERYRFPVF